MCAGCEDLGALLEQGKGDGMSEGVVYGPTALAPSRSLVYGESQFNYEEPPKAKEHLDRRHEIALATMILVPVIALYSAIAFGLYRGIAGLT